MFFKFFSKMAKQSVKQAGASLTQAIVSFDPESASEAQIEIMNDKFKELALKVAKARQDYEKEKNEADDARESFDKKKRTALILQEDIKTLEGEEKQKTEEAFERIVEDLEEFKPEMEREIKEADDAKAWLDDLEKDLKAFSNKLKQARKKIEQAAKTMERAQRTKEKALDRAKQAEERAGISNTINAFDDVLGVMEKNAKKAELEAVAANKRSDLLHTPKLEENDVIAQAMKRAEGKNTTEKSLSDRFNSL